MDELKDILKETLELFQEIIDLAVKENLDGIRSKLALLVKNLNQLLPVMEETDGGARLSVEIIQKIEVLYDSLSIGDCVSVIDVAGFELKPILQKYLEGIGGATYGK